MILEICTEDGVKYLDYAKRIAATLQEGVTKRIAFEGVLILINKYKITMLPLDQPHKITSVPRSGELKNTTMYYGEYDLTTTVPGISGTGWIPKTSNTYGYYPYMREDIFPQVGDTRTGFGVDVEEDSGDFLGEATFGNLHWISSDGTEAVSWIGPPTRVFRDLNFKSGLHWFSSYVWSYGDIIFELKPIILNDVESTEDVVLGAAKTEDGVFIISLHRLSFGIFLGVWLDDILITTLASSIEGIPFFANESVSYFVNSNGTKINIYKGASGNITASIENLAAGSGTYSETISGGLPKWNAEYAGKCLFYEDTLPASCNITFTSNTTSSVSLSSDSTDKEFSLELSGIPASKAELCWNTLGNGLYVCHIDSCVWCKWTWNFPSGIAWHYENPDDERNLSVIIDSYTGCIVGDITATSDTGAVASLPVERNAIWFWIDYVGAVEVCNDYGMPYYWSVTEGRTRYWYRVYASVTYDPSTPCTAGDGVTFDNGIITKTWIGPKFEEPTWCNTGGGGYGGCGACNYGSYICYTASYMGTQELRCP